MYTLSLEIINKCNLNCTYCYLGEKKNTYMSFETAKRAVDIAVHEAKKQYDRTLLVYFIGGEPLMAYNVIREVVEYTKLICARNSLKCQFSTTINGTLVTDEIIDFFIENRFDLKVSLDGPEKVQDLNRKDYAGNGSFKKIMEKFFLLKRYEEGSGKQISIASVITNNNYQFYAESFRYLLDLGIKKIESGIDQYCEWNMEQLSGLKSQIEAVVGIYKNFIIQTKQPIFWNLWEQHLKSYLFPCSFYACKAGLATCYVTTNGGIYTCAEMKEFKIGSVDSGLNVTRIREIVYLEDQPEDICKNCEYVNHCKTRGCQVANYGVNKSVFKPIEVNCEVTKCMYNLIKLNLTEKQLKIMKENYERRYGRHEK